MQCPGCMEQAVPDLASPRVYQSPWGGWGPLVRAKQAVFRVLNFQEIGVLTCLATPVE